MDVFQYLGASILSCAWHGINTTLFAYGQTGSGKTHTMSGNKEDVGLIPRICEALFYLINNHGGDRHWQVNASFAEIYNEMPRDLLKPGKVTLAVREDKIKGPYIEGLSSAESGWAAAGR